MPGAERPPVGNGFGGGGRVLYAACALSQFLVAGGVFVVVTTGPALREANGLRASWLPWAVLVYVLALGLLVLPLRLLIRRTRALPVLILGLWLFVQSSVALTLVSGAPAFLAFRAVQGAGAAALTATALTLTLDLDGQRPDRLLLAWSAVVVAGLGTGLAAGTVVGAEWRWALWANVPLTAAAGIPLVRLLRSTRRRNKAVGGRADAGDGLGDGGGVGVGRGDGDGVGDGAQDAAA
ncbi:MFS family permease [Streptomyces umbrinus]|uniref:MFS family permease n=1 Tax=Streptomyces umbrinus TaxID=67370 RepID=A0ABU0T4D0_9ACTN|nr:MFS transporter [Streptomyces umbrinus]MDQ1030658.1 MFS family permease [Streptomyces umbrinus]